MTDYNASERKHIRQAEKASATQERQRAEIVKGLMASASGRAFVFEELAQCHVFHTSMDLNPNVMYFREGERNRGLRLLGDVMQVSPDLFLTMMQEANARSTAAERRRGPDLRRDPEGPVGPANGSDDDWSPGDPEDLDPRDLTGH